MATACGCAVGVVRVVLPDETFDFRFDAGVAWAARLLANALRDHIDKAVERARRDSYAEGYKDGRAKRGRTQWFSTVLWS